MHEVTIRHNFETAHRLPHLRGKCESLHGHTWWASFTVEADELASGIVVEFGPFKRAVRDWIDTHLDHGTMLGPDDPLVPLLRSHGCKVHQVPGWPTVENVTVLLAEVAAERLTQIPRAASVRLTRVDVTETPVNQATWQR